MRVLVSIQQRRVGLRGAEKLGLSGYAIACPFNSAASASAASIAQRNNSWLYSCPFNSAASASAALSV